MLTTRGPEIAVDPRIDMTPSAKSAWFRLIDNTTDCITQSINRTVQISTGHAVGLLGFYNRIKGVTFILYDRHSNLVYACARLPNGLLRIFAVVKRKATVTRLVKIDEIATPFVL